MQQLCEFLSRFCNCYFFIKLGCLINFSQFKFLELTYSNLPILEKTLFEGIDEKVPCSQFFLFFVFFFAIFAKGFSCKQLGYF